MLGLMEPYRGSIRYGDGLNRNEIGYTAPEKPAAKGLSRFGVGRWSPRASPRGRCF
jgi:hypothetical protein